MEQVKLDDDGCAPGCTYRHHGFHVVDCKPRKKTRETLPEDVIYEHVAKAIQRIKDVYPQQSSRCPWCGNKHDAHNFDCPTPDIWYLLTALASETARADAAERQVETLREAVALRQTRADDLENELARLRAHLAELEQKR